jgi:5-methylthioribose kinase
MAHELLDELGLASGDDVEVAPLGGGVSSDIFKVTTGDRVFVVKRALARLKVAADWQAPIERNRYEVAWLREAAAIDPAMVPEVLAADDAGGIFAMAWLDPVRHPVWKDELRAGRVDLAFAAEVGRRMAAVHAATAGRADVARRFATDRIFHSIRLEPYLEATALRHATVAAALMALSQKTLATRRALVHGDVSPKNILAGPNGPIFLDAECAWYGDPAFDLAFCLNHLLLKCLWNRGASPSFLAAFEALRDGYLASVDWEPAAELEARAAALLPGLFLARVDGKSPVEYVTEERDRELVRSVALPLVAVAPDRLATISESWRAALQRQSSGEGQ